jgi:hypothetical protein
MAQWPGKEILFNLEGLPAGYFELSKACPSGMSFNLRKTQLYIKSLILISL